MNALRHRPAEVIFLVVAFILGVMALQGASTLPPPFYEKLGPAAFPRAIGVIILALAGMKLISTLVRPLPPAPVDPEADAAPARDYGRAFGMFVLMWVYLGAMSYRLADFRITTALFLFAAMWLAAGRSKVVTLVLMLAACIALSLGMDFFFRKFFFLDL
ncbi:tripartite tricarboxylate transporter TctB family protein [Pararhizobium haloflavum]|uniref:tripartite tricarboxylate transporter TctB family protein n=1 Tax=Pararhizobium haloflavum TaxID=2037914 RepID=UPI000C18AE1C|nr:tripartite tricarboxylate transporter TctB family protein [Pararhizobium haloflavum]